MCPEEEVYSQSVNLYYVLYILVSAKASSVTSVYNETVTVFTNNNEAYFRAEAHTVLLGGSGKTHELGIMLEAETVSGTRKESHSCLKNRRL